LIIGDWYCYCVIIDIDDDIVDIGTVLLCVIDLRDDYYCYCDIEMIHYCTYCYWWLSLLVLIIIVIIIDMMIFIDIDDIGYYYYYCVIIIDTWYYCCYYYSDHWLLLILYYYYYWLLMIMRTIIVVEKWIYYCVDSWYECVMTEKYCIIVYWWSITLLHDHGNVDWTVEIILLTVLLLIM